MERFPQLKKTLQSAQDFSKRIRLRGIAPSWILAFVLMVLTITVIHQSTRLNQLENHASKMALKNSLTKRELSPRLIVSKTDVVAGAIYTRWGRMTCPSKSSKLVYAGIVGGQCHSHTGGSSTILCLPMDPTWGNYTDVGEESQYIYGAEYEISHYTSVHKSGLFSDANSKTLQNHNVPCAVCQTLKPATIMMLPARTTCYPGWTLEYSGYLMSEHYRHNGRTPFTCIDVAPEADPAGYRDENGVLFYHVQASCGSLPCPPYVQGKELTCAVCSQSQRSHVHKFRFDNKTREMKDEPTLA